MTFPSSADEAPVSRRRRPSAGRLIAAGVVIVLVAIVLAWLLPPLGTGNAGVAAGPPGSEQEADPQTDAVQIKFVPSGEVRFGVEIRNTTFLPVTIAGLRGGRWVIEDVHLVLGTDPDYVGLEDGHVRAFEPITLSPGATQLVGVIGRFPACPNARPNWATGTTATFTALRFDVRVAGILPAESDVALLQPVDLVGDADVACPR